MTQNINICIKLQENYKFSENEYIGWESMNCSCMLVLYPLFKHILFKEKNWPLSWLIYPYFRTLYFLPYSTIFHFTWFHITPNKNNLCLKHGCVYVFLETLGFVFICSCGFCCGCFIIEKLQAGRGKIIQ